MAKCRFASTNQFKFIEKNFDYVFQTADNTTFTDLTEAARSQTAGDVVATGSSTNHRLYLGMREEKFFALYAILSALATGGARDWNYYNGTAFTALADGPVMFKQNANFTLTTDHEVMAAWTEAAVTGWTRTTVNKVLAYWLELRVDTATNSPTFSYLSTRNIFASSEELVSDPSAHAGTDSPSDEWRSQYKTIQVRPGMNDKLNYNIGAGELTLSLTWGDYRSAALASHLESLLGTGFTVTFDDVTGYTFTKSTGTFQLLCATGTNKATSIFPTLGFDCVSNKTGALTYTTDRLRTTSGGTYTITAANKNFRFTDSGARNIDLTEGRYNAGSLQSMVKAAMDGSGGGFTDYDLHFDEQSEVWTVRRAGGNISIDASGTFPTVIGLAVAVSAASHSGTARRIHTGEWLILIAQTDSVPNIDTFIGLNHNLTASSVVSSEEYSGGGSFTNSETWTYGTKLYAEPSPAHNSNIIRINIEDKTNADGFVDLGLAAGFDFGDGYFEVEEQFDYNVQLNNQEYSDTSRGSFGVKHTTIQNIPDGISLTFPVVSDTDKENIRTMAKELGTGTPFLLIPDIDSLNITEEMMWVTLESLPTYDMLEVDADDLSSATWTVEMSLEEFI